MTAQIKIRAGAPLLAALRAGGDEFPTERINAVAERYLAMVEGCRPVFSRAEWMAIFDALNGIGVADLSAADDRHIPAWHGIAQEVADAPGLSRWGVDQAALAGTVAALPEPARIAIVETAQRFWALADLPDSQALDLATQHPAMWPGNEQ